MPIRLSTPDSELDAYIDASLEKARQVIINTFAYVGESCVTEARDNGSYIDQTGNLRSSIGYAVVVDGQIVRSKVSEQVKDGVAGKGEATAFLSRLASEHKTGICLIVVAGMNYAVYVEGRGKNVLTSAKLLADRLVPQMLEQLGFTIKRI
jgi:hypothetical protein